jgi:osmotically-inducible protein OsmY
VIKPIRIIVKNGHITLEGVVDSEADKNLVNMRARGVSGSFSVTNNLMVSSGK